MLDVLCAVLPISSSMCQAQEQIGDTVRFPDSLRGMRQMLKEDNRNGNHLLAVLDESEWARVAPHLVEKRACECYRVVRKECERLLPDLKAM